MIRFCLLVLAIMGCSAAAADHERLGDQAYRDGQFARAFTEYQAAARGGARSRVHAKAAAAAVRGGDLPGAIEAYRALAQADPTRAVEAAVGLERVARQAERQGGAHLATVARAVLALREVAPDRPLGRLVLPPMSGAEIEPSELLGLLPTALATASTARAVDSLLLRYADAQRSTVACDGAAKSYRTLLRRTQDARHREAARAGFVECAALLGRDALAAGDAGAAERWFDLVLGMEPEGAIAWRARIGLGDARLMQGDALGAAVAYQTVLSAAGVSDSLRQSATTKLNSLGAASVEPPSGGDA